MTAENGRREYLSQAGPQRCLSCLSGKMPTARDFVAHWIIKYASNKQIVRLIDRIEWFILRPLLRFVRLKRMDAALDESLHINWINTYVQQKIYTWTFLSSTS